MNTALEVVFVGMWRGHR